MRLLVASLIAACAALSGCAAWSVLGHEVMHGWLGAFHP